MRTAAAVDIPRFMGDWYVLAHIPASEEKNAWNAIESYRLRDGTTDTVEVTFTFREGAFDGPKETLTPTGHVSADPAVWGMHFYWWQGPFRFEYLVADLDAAYQTTVIGRNARDYVWIMARTPTLPDAEWARVLGVVKDAGYDVAKLRRVPQRWGELPDLSPSDRR
jgi:apolipoprotein D and lipocalin family protein